MKNRRMELKRVRGRQTLHKGWRGGGERRVWEEQIGGAAIKERWWNDEKGNGGGRCSMTDAGMKEMRERDRWKTNTGKKVEKVRVEKDA